MTPSSAWRQDGTHSSRCKEIWALFKFQLTVSRKPPARHKPSPGKRSTLAHRGAVGREPSTASQVDITDWKRGHHPVVRLNRPRHQTAALPHHHFLTFVGLDPNFAFDAELILLRSNPFGLPPAIDADAFAQRIPLDHIHALDTRRGKHPLSVRVVGAGPPQKRETLPAGKGCRYCTRLSGSKVQRYSGKAPGASLAGWGGRWHFDRLRRGV